MQKNVKARRTEPTRWVCSFAERRKLAFDSNSSTFFFAHFSHKRVCVSARRPVCFVRSTNKKGTNTIVIRANAIIIRANTRFAPTIRKLNVCIGDRRSVFVRSTKSIIIMDYELHWSRYSVLSDTYSIYIDL